PGSSSGAKPNNINPWTFVRGDILDLVFELAFGFKPARLPIGAHSYLLCRRLPSFVAPKYANQPSESCSETPDSTERVNGSVGYTSPNECEPILKIATWGDIDTPQGVVPAVLPVCRRLRSVTRCRSKKSTSCRCVFCSPKQRRSGGE